MSQSLSTTPRRSAGTATTATWRAHSVAARSAGFTDTLAARRAGIAVAAGLVTLGGIAGAPAAHAQGSGPSSSATVASPVSYSSSSSSSSSTMYTTANLNVRTGPGTNYRRVTTLPKGTEVRTTGRTTSGWLRSSGAIPCGREHRS